MIADKYIVVDEINCFVDAVFLYKSTLKVAGEPTFLNSLKRTCTVKVNNS